MIAEEGVNRVGMPDSPTSTSVEKVRLSSEGCVIRGHRRELIFIDKRAQRNSRS